MCVLRGSLRSRLSMKKNQNCNTRLHPEVLA